MAICWSFLLNHSWLLECCHSLLVIKELADHVICPIAYKRRRACSNHCLTLCDPKDCSQPGSSVPGIFQARILKWVAISFSKCKGLQCNCGVLVLESFRSRLGHRSYCILVIQSWASYFLQVSIFLIGKTGLLIIPNKYNYWTLWR